MRLPILLIVVTALMIPSCSRESSPSPKTGVSLVPSEAKEPEEAKAPPSEEVEKELASLRGVWELVETEVEGRLTKEDPVIQFRTFQGDEMVDEQQDAPNLTYRGKIKIDPTRNPKTLDFYVLNTKNPVKYVYDLAGDTLRFSSSLNQNGYPKQITGKGTGQVLSLYKRKK